MHRSSRTAVCVATGLVLSAAALVAAPAGAADNGDLIVFTRGGDLWVVSPNGGDMSQITDTPEVEDSPSWTPDGNGIRFVRASAKGADGEVVEKPFPTGEEKTLAVGVDDVDWSPDGTRVTYTRDLPVRKNQTQQDVFVNDASFASSTERNVSNHPSHDANPDFSSTGKIAFDSTRAGSSSSVWVADDLDAATPTLERVPTSDPQDGGKFPAWSPDGALLVYMEYVEPTVNWGLRIFDGQHEKRLTAGGGNEWDAEFSPDGTQVVFAHWSGSPKEKFHIRRVAVGGGADTIVTQADGVVSRQPSWRPRPTTTTGTVGGTDPSPSPSPCILSPLVPCP